MNKYYIIYNTKITQWPDLCSKVSSFKQNFIIYCKINTALYRKEAIWKMTSHFQGFKPKQLVLLVVSFPVQFFSIPELCCTWKHVLLFKANPYCLQLVHDMLFLATNESLKHRRKDWHGHVDFLSLWNVVLEHFKISVSQYLKQMWYWAILQSVA